MTIDHDDHEARLLYAVVLERRRNTSAMRHIGSRRYVVQAGGQIRASIRPSPVEAQCTIGNNSPSKSPSDESCFAG